VFKRDDIISATDLTDATAKPDTVCDRDGP
jgi:hypothetical protein